MRITRSDCLQCICMSHTGSWPLACHLLLRIMHCIHWRHRLPHCPKLSAAWQNPHEDGPIANGPTEEFICLNPLDKLFIPWGNPCSLCWPLLLTSASLPPPAPLFLSSLMAFMDQVSFWRCLHSAITWEIATLDGKPSVMQTLHGSLSRTFTSLVYHLWFKHQLPADLQWFPLGQVFFKWFSLAHLWHFRWERVVA